MLRLVAMISQSPRATPVTRPCWFTVAICSLEEDQITPLSLASFGSTVAFTTAVFPALTVISLWFSVISSALSPMTNADEGPML